MRIALLCGLVGLVCLVHCQEVKATPKDGVAKVKPGPIEATTADVDPFNEDVQEDTPFHFDDAGFETKTPSNVEQATPAAVKKAPVKEEASPEPAPKPEPLPTHTAKEEYKHNEHTHEGAHQHQSQPEPIVKPVAEPVPHAVEPKVEPLPEPVAEPEPENEPSPEPTSKPLPEPAAEPAPIASESPKAAPVPEPAALPEPKAEPEPHHHKAPSNGEPQPLPEPAIKFDNIKDEDYGDNQGEEAKPDAVDNEIIEQLVNKFLNTGSIANNQSGPNYANPAAQALVDSSEYWNTKDLKEVGAIKDEKMASVWLEGYYKEAQKVLYQVTTSGWRYFTGISSTSRKALAEAEEVLSRFVRATAMQAKQYDAASMSEEIKKQLNYVSFEGMSALSAEDHAAFTKAQDHINQQISESLTCDKGASAPCTLKKIDIGGIYHSEKDADRLQSLWTAYVKNMARLKPHYQKLLDFTNTAAKNNGFSDGGAMWRAAFDMSTKNTPAKIDLKMEINKIYQKIAPLYKQLHAYMRRQIAGIYKNPKGLTRDTAVPAHLFGSTEGGDWSTHFDETKPFNDDDSTKEDITMAMMTQNYTSKTMFTKAYRYFKSIGFPPLPKTFWTNSVFARVWSKDMLCQPAAAFDMRDGADFRVKACAQLGEPDFKLAHSLLGQVYYQYLYREQPLAYRDAASPSINEAIANVFSHLASNPHYLYSQNLIQPEELDIKESLIVNKLYKEALENIAKLPFSLVADTWRYEYMEGKMKAEDMNDRWWKLRETLEGVRAPQPYNASNVDAFMHTQVNQIHSPATRNLISYIAQFQILKSVCPPETPLAEGCILSEDTTTKLRQMMKQGSSINWLKALEMLTGNATLNAEPLLEYYAPLMNWLQNTNEIDQVSVGWDGEGAPFAAEDIPQPRTSDSVSSGILSEDRVAYPGGECSSGQDCLLDSHCDGKKCVCNEGMFTFVAGTSVSCVPGNPRDSGFGDANGGLIVGLFPTETTTADPKAEPEPKPSSKAETTTHKVHSTKSSSSWSLGVAVMALLLVFWCNSE